MLNNDADAADLVQGLFVQLWQRGQSDLSLPYLYRALTRRCLNYIRDERNRARLLDREQSILHMSSRTMPDDYTLTVQGLFRLADQLAPEVFEVFVYRYFDEMGQEEIAAVAGVSRRTVQKRLKAAQRATVLLRGEEVP